MEFLKKASKHAWANMRYWGIKSLSFASTKVPVRFSYWVANVVGDVSYFILREHAANAVSNMRRVMGERASWQAVKANARYSFRNYAKMMFEFIRFPQLDQEDLFKSVTEQRGWDHLHAAHAKGTGVIAVTGHFGNWDLAGALLTAHGLPINAVADSFEPEKMDQLVNGTREKKGLRIIRLDTGSLKRIFTALKKNEFVIVVFDRPLEGKGVSVKFFGETAWLPEGPAAIALKTRAAIIVGYCIRNRGDKTFYLSCEPPVEYEHLLTGDKERDIQIITQEIASRMEVIIRRHPDQWYMFRPMWPRTERHDAEIKRRRFWGGKGSMEMAAW